MNQKTPNIIVKITNAGTDNYLFNAPFGPKNIRKPSWTTDRAKAKKFWDNVDADNYITHFANHPGNYLTENFTS